MGSDVRASLLVNSVLSDLKHGGRFDHMHDQQGRELRRRTLPPDLGAILSAPRHVAGRLL
jgi:hypothetical protein